MSANVHDDLQPAATMSDDDFDEFDSSDLTDLDDDDEYPLNGTQAAKKAANEYKIRGALNAPRATSYTTQALHGV